MPRIIKFREDERGVSVIIGAVLLLMILVMLYTTIQVYQVPVWNKGVEYEHMGVVYNDMMFLKSDIENVAMLKTPKSSIIHMGVKYPERMFFTNPGPGVAGMLSIDTENMKIVVDYTVNESGYLITRTKTYNSSRIIYEAYGTINSPKLVYEHGIIIRDWGTANITSDEQSLIVNDKLYIPVVTGNPSSSSKTSMETESLDIKPYPSVSAITNVTSINITIDTNYPSIWSELLADVNTSYTKAYISNNRIIINCTSTAMSNLTFPEGQTTGTLNAGMIKPPSPGAYIEAEERMGGIPCGPGSSYVTRDSEWVKVPSSDKIKEFTITDIGFDFSKHKEATIKFEITDSDGDKWKCEEIKFKDGTPITIEKIHIKSEPKTGPHTNYDNDGLNLPYDPDEGIDLLHLTEQYPTLPNPDEYNAANYPNAGIDSVNIFKITGLDHIFYVKFNIY